MSLSCPACGADNPVAARFCNQCGQRLDAAPKPGPRADRASYTPKHLADKVFKIRAALEGERKRVTVLFCDIKGSTRLAEEAGAEQWHLILDRFFTILSGAVHRYEGTVNQYTGDGIMALFGAPIAHEDHAQRASFAALEMQREVRRFADELRLQKGLNLSMRVGLNTGEVIVGRIGDDLRMDYTAQGPTVNLAARMEHICEPGRIYLTRNTAKLVEGYFQLRDLGRMSVAGLEDALEVYELEGEGQLKSRLDRSLARGASLFVGREQELGLLTAALERVRGGEGQVVAVVGNAGIGKSRLCHEFTRAVEDSGIAVHRATGVPYASALPMFPVQTLARSRLGIGERTTSADVRKLVAGELLLRDPGLAGILPVIFDFLGAGTEGVHMAPDQAAVARDRMLDLLARHLPCSDRPQILLIEDLHFLDAASEEFLARMCAQIRASKTLLLLNYRPDYVNEWLIPHLDEQIAVSALGAEQLENLARDWLGPHASLNGVARRIRERAGGNPFFVEEAVLALEDAGFLRGERGAYQLARPIDDWPVPDTVHALLAARVDRLEGVHKDLLQTAAVIGTEFSAGGLAALAEVEVDEALGALEDAGFIHQRRSGGAVEYAFCHPLMREVAYSTQLEARRRQMHARLAAALEQQHPREPPSEAAVRIAWHWQAAGEWARAGSWNIQASRWGAGRDLRIAHEHTELAIQNLDRAPLTDEVHRLRIAARSALIRNGQFVALEPGRVDRAYAEAQQMARDCGDVACSAELMVSYSNEALHRGDAASAAQLAADAVKLATEAGLQPMITRFRLAILIAHNAAGLPREGIELVDVGGADWRTRPIDEDNVMSRGFYGSMLAWLGRLPEAHENLDGAIAFAAKTARSASWMHAFRVDLCGFSGDYSRALPEARLSIQHAEEFGSPFFKAISARALARAHMMHGRHEEAVPLLEAARPLVAPGGMAHQLEASFLAVMSEAYLGTGRVEQAHETALAAIASAQRSRSRVWEITGWLALLALPVGGPWSARVAEGLARAGDLIQSSGTIGFRPWLSLAAAQWAGETAQRERHQAAALADFAGQGATEHVRRWRRQLDIAA
jgi:class 3 adenylate cyclase